MVEEVRELCPRGGSLAHEVAPDFNRVEPRRVARALRFRNPLSVAVPERQRHAGDEPQAVKPLLALVGGAELEVRVLPPDLRLQRRLAAREPRRRLAHLRMPHEVERGGGAGRQGVRGVQLDGRHAERDARQQTEDLHERGLFRLRFAPQVPQRMEAPVAAAARRREVARRDLARRAEFFRNFERTADAGVRLVGRQQRQPSAQRGEAHGRLPRLGRHIPFRRAHGLGVRPGVVRRRLLLATGHARKRDREGERRSHEERRTVRLEDAQGVEIELRVVPPARLGRDPFRIRLLEP